MSLLPDPRPVSENYPAALGGGFVIGTLGGLIGLGGAEFRLPLLIGVFHFAALEAVILNKAMSLVVVASALPFRASAVPFSDIAAQWPIILNLLAGSLIGAWLGAGWAMRLKSASLYRVIAVLLGIIAAVLASAHELEESVPLLSGAAEILAGVLAGLIIGVVASLLGVAGGELLIPTFVLFYGIDIKLAGSLSLAVSLPTILVGFIRYSRDQSFSVLGAHQKFFLIMAVGSIIGTFIGGLLLGLVPNAVLIPALVAILLVSAVKIWRHATDAQVTIV
ncbi:MAG: sulfite exporter TauE/SafE family protein [Hyphomicrobiales bacterium]|nr:sulfite exporter TauE/SafE family protein [Hyphomicrobiales bacterium]